MAVVGIICEYNPFHLGHLHQIKQIKNEMPDATVIAIMSGNVVQRGEFAIIDKRERAKIALENGVNAVFEIPYPYSGSTAEIFANAGVELAYRLGCDYICFGIEEQTVEILEKVASIIDTAEFEAELNRAISDKISSFISAKAIALEKFGFELPKSANDMLAVEYIRAISKKRIGLKYRAIQRNGSRYNDDSIGEMMSASAIRKQFYKNNEFLSVPSAPLYEKIASQGNYLDLLAINRYMHMFAYMNLNKKEKAFDTSVEMLSLIHEAAKESNDSDDFINRLSSKTYTTARLKRTLLYCLFSVKSVDFVPKFTFLLGMDAIGRNHLNKIKKQKAFSVITKHSEIKKLKKKEQSQAEKSYVVDALYNTFLKQQEKPSDAYKKIPIIK